MQGGEILGFLGPNGTGKTTTICCLLDLIRPRSGKVRVPGFDPWKDPVQAIDDGMVHASIRNTLKRYFKYMDHLEEWGQAGPGEIRSLFPVTCSGHMLNLKNHPGGDLFYTSWMLK